MITDSVAPISKAAIKAARVRFVQAEDTPHAWAVRNGLNPDLVYQVLSGKRRCVRGESFKIAEMLQLRPSSSPVVAPAGADQPPPTGHTVGEGAPIEKCDRRVKLQSLGEAVL